MILLAIVMPSVLGVLAACAVGIAGFIAVHVWVHHLQDQQRARLVFGRVWLGIGIIGWGSAVAWLNSHPPEPVRACYAIPSAIMWFLTPVYLRYIAFHNSHRVAYLVVIAVGPRRLRRRHAWKGNRSRRRRTARPRAPFVPSEPRL